MREWIRPVAALLAACALGLAACGGDDDDAAKAGDGDKRGEQRSPYKQLRSGAKIQEGLDPRQTVDAYYKAIMDADGPALCGLVTKSQARKIIGLAVKTQKPIEECVVKLSGYSWGEVQKKAKGVKSVKVKSSGDTATVTLSSGKSALLQNDNGRWLIDDIKG